MEDAVLCGVRLAQFDLDNPEIIENAGRGRSYRGRLDRCDRRAARYAY